MVYDSSNSSKFFALSESIDDSIKEIDLSNKSFDRTDQGLLIKDVGILSARAKRHLAKNSGISSKLLTSLSIPLLNQSIQEQLIRSSYSKFRVGFNPSTQEVAFLQPVQKPYIRYKDALSSVEDKMFNIVGNPVTDDVITFLTKEFVITPEGEETFIGQKILYSSIQQNLSSSLLSYRVICSNGLISKRSHSAIQLSMENASPTFISEIIKARTDDCAKHANTFSDFVSDSIAKSVEVPLEVVMEDALESGLIPSRVIKQATVVGTDAISGKQKLDNVGISDFSNLWAYINLFTFVAQSFSQWAVINAAQSGAYEWGQQKLHGSAF